MVNKHTIVIVLVVAATYMYGIVDTKLQAKLGYWDSLVSIPILVLLMYSGIKALEMSGTQNQIEKVTNK